MQLFLENAHTFLHTNICIKNRHKNMHKTQKLSNFFKKMCVSRISINFSWLIFTYTLSLVFTNHGPVLWFRIFPKLFDFNENVFKSAMNCFKMSSNALLVHCHSKSFSFNLNTGCKKFVFLCCQGILYFSNEAASGPHKKITYIYWFFFFLN